MMLLKTGILIRWKDPFNVSIWFPYGSLRMVFTVLSKPPRLKKLVNRPKDGKE